MEPKMSIIVPVYNVESYLEKCLDSILEQTLDDIEIICVNDGSTDRSGDILHKYEAMDSRIVVIEQENKGLGAARNAGIVKAKGEYIGFVDSDDFVDPSMFEKLYKKAFEFNSDVVLTNVNLYYTDSGESVLFRDDNFYGRMSKTKYFTVMQHPHILQFIGVWDRIYRRELLEEHHLLNPVNRIYEDVLFTVQTCVFAERISVVNEPLYYYRKNTGRSIVDKEKTNDSFKFDFLKNLRESREFLIQCGKWEPLRKEFLAFQFQGVMYHQYNTQTRQTFLEFMKELSEILGQDDMQVIADMINERAGKIYIHLLQKRQFQLAYVLYKIRKLYRYDDLYFYFRFPRSKKYWRFQRFGYRWKCKMKAQYNLIWEIKQLRMAIEAVGKTVLKDEDESSENN